MLQYSNFKMFVVFVFLLLGMGACTEQKATHVDMYGISFDCPPGWKISETEDYGAAKYISIEKKGSTSSGIVAMAFTEEDFELDEYLQIFQKSLLDQEKIQDLVFQQVKETYYGKYKGIVSPYTFVVMSMKHAGEIYAFYENGITMCIIHQGATEDHKVNHPGFEIIMESLRL